MKATLRYLAGIAGPSGFGSNSTAEQVTQNCSSFLPSGLTALITGKSHIGPLDLENSVSAVVHGYTSVHQQKSHTRAHAHTFLTKLVMYGLYYNLLIFQITLFE